MAEQTKNILIKAAQEFKVSEFLSCKEYLSQLYVLCSEDVKSANLKSHSRQRKQRYSYLAFAEDLSFSRTNVMRLIIVGQRSLSFKAAQRIAVALAMNATTKKYWLKLAEYETAKKPKERDKTFRELMQLRTQRLSKSLDKRMLAYFGQWYHPVIRELIEGHAKPLDAKSIQDCLSFPLRLDEVKNSLELLEELNFIKKSEKNLNEFIGTGEQVSTGVEVNSIDIIRYHYKMMEMARDSITRVDADRRDIQSATISIPQQYIPVLKERIHEWLAEAMAIDRITKDNEEVYQLNVQFFPFTKEKK